MTNEVVAEAREAALRAASKSLGEFLERDEAARRLLRQDAPLPERAGYLQVMQAALADGGMGEVRLEKRRRLLEIAARDLAGELGLDRVGAALAALADACLEVALRDVDAPEGMTVVAMGKLGGRELNYVSDIDVMFMARGETGRATKAAESLLRVLGEVSPEGRAFQIDTNLRPEGRNGALVRPLDGYIEYYRRWAKPWEFQALIKARPSAGDLDAADELIEATSGLVFPPEVSPERVASIRKMKERVEEHATRAPRLRASADWADVKLGPGGIRDIEFAVQLLQLVHGGADRGVRSANTLEALTALRDGGYLADEDSAALAAGYEWLRTVEHRLQLWQERRIHHVPSDEERRSQLGRVLGFDDSPLAGAAAAFEARHRAVLSDVRSRFEKLFYRPMIEALGGSGAPRLSEDAVKDRLRVLAFRDVDRAARVLHGLVAGTSRRAKLFRVVTPALLRFLATTPLPDTGLFAFLRLGEALEDRVEALGSLRDNPPGLAFLAKVLGHGRTLGELLAQVPEELQTIAEGAGRSRLKDRERLAREAVASLQWREPEGRLDGLRRFKRREMLRVALADVGDAAGPADVGASLADLADACLEATLEGVPLPFAVIGMGKLGGRELSYASDIDVMFVHDGDPAVGEKVAEELMSAIGELTPEGQAFRIDAALRPEGKSGPLARSFDSYLEYYDRWAKPWEHQALIKARPSAGDRELGERLVAATRRHAFPERLSQEALMEIRHLKARMEKERIPRASDPRRNTKMGPGGMSDIEFAAQVLQLQHGHELPELVTTSTRDALTSAARTGLIPSRDANLLIAAYDFLMKLRNRLFFMFARPMDALPPKQEDLEALGIAMGYAEQPRQELEEDYLRITRRTRRVAQPIIYG